MPNMPEEYRENKVFHYTFDDEEINSALADLNRNSCQMLAKCKKQLLLLKVLLAVCALLLTASFEYMMFVSLWYREPIFKFVMIFTPVLAGVIGYLAANILDKTFDLNYGLFNSEFQNAYDSKYIYAFRGELQHIHSEEKLWTNVIVGNYIWRVRNKLLDLKGMEGKEVFMLLIRNYFDDDVDFECVYMKGIL